jgi:hypothetical protein
MRHIRLFALGILSFFAVLMSALLAPGTFVNRALSAALCTVFSFNSTICTVNLGQSGDRVVAATPLAVERNIEDWLVQRAPGEFDDAPSVPPGSNPQAPPFPQDPGPNQPVRPDFDNPGSGQPQSRPQVDQPNPSQPIQPELDNNSLAGIWLYSIYVPSSNGQTFLPAYNNYVEITQNSDEYIFYNCELNECSRLQGIRNNFAPSQPKKYSIKQSYDNLDIEILESINGEIFWGEVRETTSNESLYFKMERQIPLVSMYPILLASVGGTGGIIPGGGGDYNPGSRPNLNTPTPTPQPSTSSGQPSPGVDRFVSTTSKVESVKEVKPIDLDMAKQRLRSQPKILEAIEEWMKKNLGFCSSLSPEPSSREFLAFSNLQSTVSLNLPQSSLIASCIPVRNLGRLALRGAGIVALATAIGTTLAVADWCINNPEGCKLLATNPGATARAIGGQINPSSGSAPVVTSFTCNGGKTCTLARGATAQLMFTYEDKDGNASSWEVSGYTIGTPVGKGTISPPNGSGTINSKVRCVGSGGPKDASNSVSVTDVTGLKSNSLSVTVKCN